MKVANKPSSRLRRVLIANRGEIAVRIARTLREMGISPVAIYSDADRPSPHVRACDMAFHVGPPLAADSYLRGDAIVEVAKKAAVDAVHPGYGFLSEDPAFAEAVRDAGLVFIGPSSSAMRTMGSKTGAREAMHKAGVPCVPGSDGPVQSPEDARRVAQRIGYPVMLKAAAGGGGRGMRTVGSSADLKSAFRAAESEARNAFGDATVYIEKCIIKPRHIEIQIFGGPDGTSVSLGERECSMQRRHQKVLEETPSAVVTDDMRQRLGEVACRAADAVGYVGAGTVEFIVDQDCNFYFLEMNTRLQVEHPVTELCCGIDLVEAQVLVADGQPLPWAHEPLVPRGHAIEARIYAEDPARGFVPCPGVIRELALPHGPGVRVDCGVALGFEVPTYYDPMIAKVAVWAQDRERARRRLHRALGEMVVKGTVTNTMFLRRLLELPAFIQGDYHTGTLGDALACVYPEPPQDIVDVGIAAMVIQAYRRDVVCGGKWGGGRDARTVPPPVASSSGWRHGSWRFRGG